MTYNICMILQLKILYVKMKFNNSGIKKVSRPTSKAGKSTVYAASRLSVYYSNSICPRWFSVLSLIKNIIIPFIFTSITMFTFIENRMSALQRRHCRKDVLRERLFYSFHIRPKLSRHK